MDLKVSASEMSDQTGKPSSAEHEPTETQPKKPVKPGIEDASMIKTQEIFGAVKIRDGLFLGDQYSP